MWAIVFVVLGGTSVPVTAGGVDADNPCPALVREFDRKLISPLVTHEQLLANVECQNEIDAGRSPSEIRFAMVEAADILNVVWRGRHETQLERGSFFRIPLSDDPEVKRRWAAFKRRKPEGPVKSRDIASLARFAAQKPEHELDHLVHVHGSILRGVSKKNGELIYDGPELEAAVRVRLPATLYLQGRYVNTNDSRFQIASALAGIERRRLRVGIGASFVQQEGEEDLLHPAFDVEFGLSRVVSIDVSSFGGIGDGGAWYRAGFGLHFEDRVNFGTGFTWRPDRNRLRTGGSARLDVRVVGPVYLFANGWVGPVTGGGGGVTAVF